MNRDLTVVLSGPLAGRLLLLKQCEQNDCVEMSEQPIAGANHGLPTDRKTGWLTVYAPSLDVVEQVLELMPDWSIRLHWPTPGCRKCGGEGCVACAGSGLNNEPPSTPDFDVCAEIAALKAQVAKLGGEVR